MLVQYVVFIFRRWEHHLVLISVYCIIIHMYCRWQNMTVSYITWFFQDSSSSVVLVELTGIKDLDDINQEISQLQRSESSCMDNYTLHITGFSLVTYLALFAFYTLIFEFLVHSEKRILQAEIRQKEEALRQRNGEVQVRLICALSHLLQSQTNTWKLNTDLSL